MERWLRATRTAALGLILPAMLASCGGGGGGTIQLFFGSNGSGSCDRIVVEVDLDAASAVLARRDDESADCALAALLDTAGCEIDVEEIDDGDTLRVTIDDCTVPPVAALFACGFTTADLSEFDDVAVADCDCASSGCDQAPPVCVSSDEDPGTCEDCDNGRDDDLNGFVDCNDPNCEHAAVCHAPTTTTTVPEDTTTTLPPDTTTTTLPLLDCDLTFRMLDDVTAGSLQWVTGYDGSAGELEGLGADVECESLTAETLSAFHDDDSAESVESGLISVAGIDGPVDLARCRWVGRSKPSAADFDIGDVDAPTAELALLPDPDIVDRRINCGVGEPTPTTMSDDTTTTTTTSLPETTTTTIVSDEEVSVVFKLTAAGAPLGALQVLADYGATSGEFDGLGAAVKCVKNIPNALFAPNDSDGARKLKLGFIALDGFGAPADLATCTFKGGVPSAEDFVLTIEDATDINGETTSAAVSVEVVAVP